MIDIFKRARRVSAPLVAINTPDPAATVQAIIGAVEDGVPLVEWNSMAGMVSLNKRGRDAIAQAAEKSNVLQESTSNPMEAMRMAASFPAKTLMFVHNAPRWLPSGGAEDPSRAIVAQGLWNLRDSYKQDNRMAILLGLQVALPDEISNDVVVIEEPLPTPDELAVIVREQYENAGLQPPTDDIVAKAVDAVSGLAAFPAEQVVAMSIKKSGVDLDMLWERKRQVISQTPGLSVNKTKGKFAEVGGCANVKGLLSRVITGKRPPRAIVWMDEIEKALAGAGGDTSGTSQDQLNQILTYMQEENATGVILIGLPGSAKSMIAKAFGNEAGVPTIQFDMGGMKGSLVGQSEARVRQALKVVTAVGQGRVFFVATCNSIGALPPELRRRFKLGTFFFDVPTKEERDNIWKLYLDRYKLTFTKENPRPNDADWSGAEIAACVENADEYGMTFVEAAGYIVPVARSMGKVLDNLRDLAHNKFLSAAHPGLYNKDGEPSDPLAAYESVDAATPKAGRKPSRRLEVTD